MGKVKEAGRPLSSWGQAETLVQRVLGHSGWALAWRPELRVGDGTRSGM